MLRMILITGIRNIYLIHAKLHQVTGIRKIYLIHAKLHQVTQPAITFSKLTIETLERGVEHVQS